MAFVCGLLALGLLLTAWRHDGGWRVWYLACAALNAWAASAMAWDRFEYAWQLMPAVLTWAPIL